MKLTKDTSVMSFNVSSLEHLRRHSWLLIPPAKFESVICTLKVIVNMLLMPLQNVQNLLKKNRSENSSEKRTKLHCRYSLGVRYS